MKSSREIIRLVLASASDVEEERRIVEQVVQEVNSPTGERLRIIVDLVRWEDVPPGFSEGGPQEHIDDAFQIPECDLVVGVFSKRFGTGTVHEINVARESRKLTGKPQIMLYFRQAGPLPTKSEMEHFSRLLKFKEEVQPEGLYVEYDDAEEFRKRLRDDLTRKMFDFAESHLAFHSGENVLAGAVSATTTLLRTEGITEAVGNLDITLWTPLQRVETKIDIAVFFNTNLTGRLLEGNLSEGVTLLRMDQKREHVQASLAGRQTGANSVLFGSVPIKLDPGNEVIMLRITGIRVNAVQLGLSRKAPTKVAAYLQIQTGDSQVLLLNPQCVMGLTYPGYVFELRSALDGAFRLVDISQRDGLNRNLREN